MRKLILLSILFFGGVFYSNAQNVLPFKTWDFPKRIGFVPFKSMHTLMMEHLSVLISNEKFKRTGEMPNAKIELEKLEKIFQMKIDSTKNYKMPNPLAPKKKF